MAVTNELEEPEVEVVVVGIRAMTLRGTRQRAVVDEDEAPNTLLLSLCGSWKC